MGDLFTLTQYDLPIKIGVCSTMAFLERSSSRWKSPDYRLSDGLEEYKLCEASAPDRYF
jgi:hypothetical protein